MSLSSGRSFQETHFKLSLHGGTHPASLVSIVVFFLPELRKGLLGVLRKATARTSLKTIAPEQLDSKMRKPPSSREPVSMEGSHERRHLDSKWCGGQRWKEIELMNGERRTGPKTTLRSPSV